MEQATNIVILVAVLATAALMLAFAVRWFKRRVSDWRNDTADAVTLSEAARIAYHQAVAERMSIAGTAEYQKTRDDAVRWFERSIREVVPVTSVEDAEQISRADLKRYIRWARTVR